MTKATGVGRGRPKGAKNKRTLAAERAAKKAAEKLADVIPGAFGGDGHAYLMSIYKDPEQPVAVRIDAAKAAMPYEKPRLATVEQVGNPNRPIESVTTHRLDPSSAAIIEKLVK